MEEQLVRAVFADDLPTVQRILQLPDGADLVNAGDERNGETALHVAAQRGRLAILRAILQTEGVDVNVVERTGASPLHYACFGAKYARRLPIVQALLEAGADPSAADRDSWTPLYIAILRDGPIGVVEALLDGGADPAA